MNNASPQKILIVEDESKLAGVLADYLGQAGYVSHWLANGIEVAPWIRENKPDMLLLDLMLPGRDGMELCRDIRKFSTVPIIMMTARVEEIDRLLGLELGADDYICKPYSPREVLARIKAIFRRIDYLTATDETFAVNGERMEIRCLGRPLDLTPVEFRLLNALVGTPGRVYSRDQLLSQMHEDHRVVTDRTIDSHIKNLRKKIANILPGREVIVSVYGVGYKLEVRDWACTRAQSITL
jgi:two-component system response regulator BaeR